jgi:LCP family protein required for cell wall assembly
MKRYLTRRNILLFLAGCIVFYLVFPPPPTSILILGVDSRGQEGWQARADSIMLAGIRPRFLQVGLLSIPRDLSLNVPGYGMQRVNVTHVLGEMEGPGGGPELMRAALAENFGVTVDRYVRLDFDGFVALIDAVGGVTIDVEQPLIDYNYPTEDFAVTTVEFAAGQQHMDGARALIYARTRYADDDYQRTRRQQQVVTALLGKLILPWNWPGAVVTLNNYVDTNLNVWDLVVLAPSMVIGGARAERLTIDRSLITATADGVAVPDYAQLAPWLRAHFD